MMHHPLFFSLIVVTRNQASQLPTILAELTNFISPLVADYELIVVDNASQDNSVEVLKKLTSKEGLPNLQVYTLTKEIDAVTAAWVGFENALGDFIGIIDPLADDLEFLPTMLDHAVKGSDVVFACNQQIAKQSLLYNICLKGFYKIYQWFNNIDLAKEAPQYRILSRKVVNIILQYPIPAIAYRHLPATGGFSKVNLSYSAAPKNAVKRQLGASVLRSIHMLIATTQSPLRIITGLCLFGAASNLLYSLYVIMVALYKQNVAPGWVTLSLQQSGMFFLLSLVLLVLSEYILYITNLSGKTPFYHIAQEFTSAVIRRREKLNIESMGLDAYSKQNGL